MGVLVGRSWSASYPVLFRYQPLIIKGHPDGKMDSEAIGRRPGFVIVRKPFWMIAWRTPGCASIDSCCLWSAMFWLFPDSRLMYAIADLDAGIVEFKFCFVLGFLFPFPQIGVQILARCTRFTDFYPRHCPWIEHGPRVVWTRRRTEKKRPFYLEWSGYLYYIWSWTNNSNGWDRITTLLLALQVLHIANDPIHLRATWLF